MTDWPLGITDGQGRRGLKTRHSVATSKRHLCRRAGGGCRLYLLGFGLDFHAGGCLCGGVLWGDGKCQVLEWGEVCY